MSQEYFEILLKLSKKAAKKGEIPVSAIIVYNNKIIAKAYNNRQSKKNILGHAELIALKKASKKMKDWRLDNCNMYVTLKPCKICENAINQSRINKVFYILDKPENKKEYNKTTYEQTYEIKYQEKYAQELKGFFKNQRDKKKNM